MTPRNRHQQLRYGTIVVIALLAQASPAGAAGGHDGVDCRLCHADAGLVTDATRLEQQRQRISCHAEALTAGPAPAFHGRGRCLDCHGFHAAGTVTTAVGTLDLAALPGVDRAHCRACHDGKGSLTDLSDAHRAAGRLYHEHAADLKGRDPSTPCLWCHSRDRSTAWAAAPAADRIAFAEHATHPFGIPVRPGQGPVVRRMRAVLDPRIPLPNGQLACVSCHQLTATTKDRLIPFPTARDLCLGCHDLNPDAPSGLLLAGLGSP